MNDPIQSATPPANLSGEELHSVLFFQLVMQQSHLATMLMGKTPHPETGQVTKDLDSAKMFIDQLEMLEAKTKGNLNKEESALLKQTLMGLRRGFVKAVEAPAAAPQPASPTTPAATPSAEPPAPPASEAADDEHRKKFSKKY
jgi:hypothetical protein